MCDKMQSIEKLRLNNVKTCESLSPAVVSPVTDLAVNLGSLSTGGNSDRFYHGSNRLHIYSPQMDATPKRRISWSGLDTPVRTLADKTNHDDSLNQSLTDSDCSFTISRPPKLSALRSKNSAADLQSPTVLRNIPSSVTMVQFDSCGGSPVVASKGVLFNKENIPSNLESAGENAQQTLPSPYKVSSSIVHSEESRDSLDSGYSGSLERDDLFVRSHSTSEITCSLLKSSEVRSSFSSTPPVFDNDASNGDDGFSNLFNFDNDDDLSRRSQLSSLSSLLSDPLTMQSSKFTSPSDKKSHAAPTVLRCHNNTAKKSSIRRCLSMKVESEQSPRFSGIFKSPSAPKLVDLKPTFKRPDPPQREIELTSPALKRRKSIPLATRNDNNENIKLQRSHSETEATIMKAVQRSCLEPDLIGDFSRPYTLPLTSSRNRDVKSVSAQTVADLLNGDYDQYISKYTIVDCRYPYEYLGGHIQGAKNIYSEDSILREFLPDHRKLVESKCGSQKAHVIVFHCEFSSERAPKMYRFLRNKDRHVNKECYPKLHHPEIYVLEGGYKAFYAAQQDFCVPKSYKPMVHKDHEQDLKHFRAKSKSWNGDSKSRKAVRPGLKF